jgi:muramoyltetrapeptide carboxypeptidase
LTEQRKTRPPALRPGDRIGIIAPAGAVDADALQAGCATLRQLGYEPVHDPAILDRDLYFAGSVERRAAEFNQMFARDDVHAIICARGGYGCNYLLPRVDLDVIRRHPKIFMGYSDVTTLLTYICDAAGLITFHGPMVTKDFALPGGIDLQSWEALAKPHQSRLAKFAPDEVAPLVAGRATGRFYGGCLSLLVASLGTPYEIQTDGAILLIEDLNARPYQIDRMLMQLQLAGKFEGVRGIVFGEMRGCEAAPEADHRLRDVVLRLVGPLGVPVAYGFPTGHVARANRAVPIGAAAVLHVGADVQIAFEPSVAARTDGAPARTASSGTPGSSAS